MKTIFVVYTTDKNLSMEEALKSKRYCFNTEENISKGDVLQSKSYTSYLLVVEVIEKGFLYYNKLTGDMSNELVSTNQYKIKELVFSEEPDGNVVHAKKIL